VNTGKIPVKYGIFGVVAQIPISFPYPEHVRMPGRFDA